MYSFEKRTCILLKNHITSKNYIPSNHMKKVLNDFCFNIIPLRSLGRSPSSICIHQVSFRTVRHRTVFTSNVPVRSCRTVYFRTVRYRTIRISISFETHIVLVFFRNTYMYSFEKLNSFEKLYSFEPLEENIKCLLIKYNFPSVARSFAKFHMNSPVIVPYRNAPYASYCNVPYVVTTPSQSIVPYGTVPYVFTWYVILCRSCRIIVRTIYFDFQM